MDDPIVAQHADPATAGVRAQSFGKAILIDAYEHLVMLVVPENNAAPAMTASRQKKSRAPNTSCKRSLWRRA